jgi:hypothetical protein
MTKKLTPKIKQKQQIQQQRKRSRKVIGFTAERINSDRRPVMTIKTLIKILKNYNQNAEVRMVRDIQNPVDNIPVSGVGEFEDAPRVCGFAPRVLEKKKRKQVKIYIA